MFSEVSKFFAYNSCLIYYILIEKSIDFFSKREVDRNVLNKIVKKYNITISLVSWFIFFVTLYENWNLLNYSGLVCSNHYNSMITLFYYLKYIEWTDTIFLVIKRVFRLELKIFFFLKIDLVIKYFIPCLNSLSMSLQK